MPPLLGVIKKRIVICSRISLTAQRPDMFSSGLATPETYFRSTSRKKNDAQPLFFEKNRIDTFLLSLEIRILPAHERQRPVFSPFCGQSL